jgi:acyl carrier protein
MSSGSVALTDKIVNLVEGLRPEQLRRRPIDVDQDLRSAGINSLAIVRLMMDVELTFDVAIPKEDLRLDNFRSVRAVATLVSRLGTAC